MLSSTNHDNQDETELTVCSVTHCNDMPQSYKHGVFLNKEGPALHLQETRATVKQTQSNNYMNNYLRCNYYLHLSKIRV